MRQLIEIELAAFLGSNLHEFIEDMLGHSNGHRSRTVSTLVGDIVHQIAKLRAGGILPSSPVAVPTNQALYAVIIEAFMSVVSTRQIDTLVEAPV